MNKWKNFLQFRKLNELRAKNLETVARLSKSFYDSKKLSINLYKWKEKNNLMKFINKSKIKDNIKILFNSLLVLRNRRMKLFFYSLKIAKNNLLKKIIIKNISNTYSKKILIKKFIQWKLILLKKQNEYQVENINKLNKLKIIVNNAIKRKEKFNYASIKKAINKWYLISKLINKENLNKLLLNTKKGVDIINNLYIKNSLKEPFNKIKLAEVNQKNVILKRLKKYFLKNDRINLRKAFIKFLTKVKKESAVSLKAKNIYNLKQKYSQMNKQLNLSKYFNKWKLLNKILHEEKIIDTKTITNSLNNLIKIRLQKYAFDKLKYIKRKFYLNELAKKFFKLYEKNEKLCLYNNMMKWKNIAKKIDLNISQRKKVYEMILKVLTKAFSYKKSFSILCDLLDNYFKKNYKIFFDKFKYIYRAKTNFSIKNEIQNTKISKVFHFKYKNILKENFNLNMCDNKKEKIDNTKYRERQSKNQIFNLNQKTENKNIIISLDKKRHQFYNERLLPYLIAYLNKLRIKRLKISFEYLYNRYKYNFFCNKFSTWCKSQSLLSKKKLIDNLKHNIFKQKILEYMRKSGIKKLTSYYLVITKRRNDLFILVHLTKVFKRINQLIKAVRFIRLWRLYWKLIRKENYN